MLPYYTTLLYNPTLTVLHLLQCFQHLFCKSGNGPDDDEPTSAGCQTKQLLRKGCTGRRSLEMIRKLKKTYRYGSARPFWTKAVMKKTLESTIKTKPLKHGSMFDVIWKVFSIITHWRNQDLTSSCCFHIFLFWPRHRSGPGMSAMSSMSMGGGGLGHLADFVSMAQDVTSNRM